jgi:hypothetical protein
LPLSAKAFVLRAADTGYPVSSSGIAITVSLYGPFKARIRPARIQVTTGTCGCSRQRDGDERPPSKTAENHQHYSGHGKGHLGQAKHEAHPAPDQAMLTRGCNARKRSRCLLLKPSPARCVYRSHMFSAQRCSRSPADERAGINARSTDLSIRSMVVTGG